MTPDGHVDDALALQYLIKQIAGTITEKEAGQLAGWHHANVLSEEMAQAHLYWVDGIISNQVLAVVKHLSYYDLRRVAHKLEEAAKKLRHLADSKENDIDSINPGDPRRGAPDGRRAHRDGR